MTDELDIAPIEARLEATTAGEWRVEEDWYDGPIFSLASGENIDLFADGAGRNCDEAQANAEFAVAAHNTDVPALIAEVKRLRALLEKREGEPYETMRVRLAAALKENEELRADAELGRLVRESLPDMARMSGDEAWITFDHLEQMWQVGCTGLGSFTSCDLHNAITTMVGDAQRGLGVQP